MRFRHFSALSMLVSGVFVTIALHGAAAQAPPPPASGQPVPTASPANPPPPSQAAPPPPPTATAPPPPTAAAPPPPPPQAAAPPDGPPPPQSGPPGHAAAHAVTHTNVNLRNGPGTTFTVVTLIPAGSSVEVNGCRSGWCQVAFQDQNGYIIETSIAPGGPGPMRPTPAWLRRAARSASRICWTAARLLSASTRLLPAALLLRWLLWTWTVWGLAGPRLRAALVTAATCKPILTKPGRRPLSKNEYVRR